MPTNFLDLMMWAVLAGQPALATELWGRTREPLRAARLAPSNPNPSPNPIALTLALALALALTLALTLALALALILTLTQAILASCVCKTLATYDELRPDHEELLRP